MTDSNQLVDERIVALGKDAFNDDAYNLDDPIMKDSSTLSTEYYQIRTRNVIDLTSLNAEGSVYDIEMTGSAVNEALDISRIKFAMESTIGVVDGATNIHTDNLVVATHPILPTPNILCCFKRIEVKCGAEFIEEIDNPGVVDTLLKLMYTSKDYIGAASLDGYYPNLKLTTVGDDNANARAKRYLPSPENLTDGLFLQGKRAYTIFTLPIFTRECKKIVKGLPLTFRFFRNNDNMMFEKLVKAGNLQNPVFKINALSMWYPVVRPSIAKQLEFEQRIAQPYFLQYTGVRMESLSMTTNSTEENRTLQTMEAKPKFVVIAFQLKTRNDAVGDAAHPNPLIFDHMKINRIELTVDGAKRVPYAQIENDFTVGKYDRQFSEFLHVSGAEHNYDGGSIVDYETFNSMYPLYCFDLRGSHSADIPEINKKQCKLDLFIKFGTIPNPTTYTMHCLYIYDNVLNINGTTGVVKKIMGR